MLLLSYSSVSTKSADPLKYCITLFNFCSLSTDGAFTRVGKNATPVCMSGCLHFHKKVAKLQCDGIAWNPICPIFHFIYLFQTYDQPLELHSFLATHLEETLVPSTFSLYSPSYLFLLYWSQSSLESFPNNRGFFRGALLMVPFNHMGAFHIYY